MSGTMQKYVMPAMQMLGGAGATAMGAPEIGIPLMMGGGGQLAGGAAGGSRGQAMGGGLGSMLGGLGGMMGMGGPAGGGGGMPAGFAAPGAMGTPSMGTIGAALQGNPALAGINPGQVTGVSGGPPAGGPAASAAPAGPGGGSMPSWSGAGDVGSAYLNYVNQKKLEAQRQKTAYAPAHSSAGGAPPQFSQLPQLQFAMPQY